MLNKNKPTEGNKMRKTLLIAITAVFVAMLASGPAFAQPAQFEIQAQIDPADTASFTVSRVLGDGTQASDWTVQAPGFSDLNFGTLQYNAVLGIFLPNPPHFWVIDVGSNGAGMPVVDAHYEDDNNPNGAPNNGTGLGAHAAFTYSEISGPEGSQVDTVIDKLALDHVKNLQILDTDYADGFLRIAIGLVTGDSSTPDGASPFTALDQPGIYTGTLVLTATFDHL
jgi:hypothetical protein